MKKALFTLSGTVSLVMLLLGVFALSGSAQAPASVAVYQSVANGAGVRVVYIDPNTPFPGGVTVFNSYPLSHVGQSAIPNSDAVAATEDQGPLLVTGAGQTPYGQLPAQDESASYPGTMDASGTRPGGAYAKAHAEELRADAVANYNGGPSQPIGYSESHSILNADGTLSVVSHATVQSFLLPASAFGTPAVSVTHVDVTAAITACASICPGATRNSVATSSVNVGQVLINGQPTSITDAGITINGSPVSGTPVSPGDPTGTGTVRIFTVRPTQSLSDGHAASDATGLHIVLTEPNASPPRQVEYVLGVADAQGFVVAAPPLPTNNGDVFGATNNYTAPTFTTTTTTNDSAPYYSGAPATTLAAAPHAKPATTTGKATPTRRSGSLVVAVTRAPMTLLFYLWECLVMAAAAAVVWARRARPA